ncbi:phosphoribosylamine--glycine ligase, partial [bacterium E08(2017)]
MKILVIGGGGREHTLVWKLVNDSTAPTVFCAPGNAGTAEIAENINIGAEDVDGLVEWAKENRPDLTVVGPEAPLCAGVTDSFEAEGLRVFGPSQDAAMLEGSKRFSKEVMKAAGVPTAEFAVFTDADKALEHIRSRPGAMVVKADGLAAGKGVFVCADAAEAENAVKTIMVDKSFGESGVEVVIEDCLVGEEASILALVDGENVLMLASSQDHKRVFNDDGGPNTGGMGAYSPAPVVTDDMWPTIREQVFERLIKELKSRSITYKGVLYAGLMITDDG